MDMFRPTTEVVFFDNGQNTFILMLPELLGLSWNLIRYFCCFVQ